MEINFRYATSQDSDLFFNTLLNDNSCMNQRLGYNGIDKEVVKSETYKVCVVAEVDGVVAGMGKAFGLQTNGFNYIGTFYVFPDFRRKGVGTQLLAFLEKYCFDNWNAVGVELVTIDNEPMDTLAEKSGYELMGVNTKNYYLNGKFLNQSRWAKFYARE